MWVVIKYCTKYVEDGMDGIVGPFHSYDLAKKFAEQCEFWEIYPLEFDPEF